MKAKIKGLRITDTAEILGDARGEVRRYCCVRMDEVTRLDALEHKLRSLSGQSTKRIQRPDLLSALFLSGLDLAESGVQTLMIFPRIGARYEYLLKLEDVGRVKRLIRSVWPASKGRPIMDYVLGALIRLALQVAEKEESFMSKLVKLLPVAVGTSSERPTPRW